jgi:hypothetical protein
MLYNLNWNIFIHTQCSLNKNQEGISLMVTKKFLNSSYAINTVSYVVICFLLTSQALK